jgi:hypothetical protein
MMEPPAQQPRAAAGLRVSRTEAWTDEQTTLCCVWGSD